MRLPGLLFATLVVACLGSTTYTYGQTSDQHRPAESNEPYHKHRDTRHGHDHFYPDRGSVVRDLPAGTIGVNYAGSSYRYHDGIWLEPRGPAFVVVAPPIGLVVPTLPTYTTILARSGETYLYCNDTYYRPRPDLGGYEVVNDPADPAPQAEPESFVGGKLPGASGPPAQTAVAPVAPVATPAAMLSPPSTSPVPVPVPAAASAIPAAAVSAGGSGTSIATPVSTALAVPASAVAPPPWPSTAPQASTPPVAPPTTAAPLAATAAATVPAALPAGSAPSSVTSAKGPKVFVYPRNGQNADQQARDRYDCYRFAMAQSGFDPMRSASGAAPANSELQSDYDRAQSACFDARGYTIR